MSIIRFATIAYTSNNLGDDIQTVATLPFLPHPASSFTMESLAKAQDAHTYLILMNAWWAVDPKSAFPPADCFIPVFIGFHLTPSAIPHFSLPQSMHYLKSHAPIGCRDIFTMQILQKWGIQAFFSGCLTTTFEKREALPKNGKIILVDTDRIDYLIPSSIKKEAIKTTHKFSGDPALRAKAVEDLLHLYSTSASLIITTRLHAATTCAALGIPVVFFFHTKDPRASTATQIGLSIIQYYLIPPTWFKKGLSLLNMNKLWTWCVQRYFGIRYTYFQEINWNPEPLSFEKHKTQLKEKTIEMIDAMVNRYNRSLFKSNTRSE